MWGVWCVGLGPRLRQLVCGCVAASALAGCSSDFKRADFAAWNSAYNSKGDDGIVTSSLPPVPSEPVYGSRHAAGSPYGSGPDYGYNSDRASRDAAPASYSERAVERRDLPQNPAARAPSPRQAHAATREITVNRGDTLYSLSRDHGVPIDRIRSANAMTGTELREGQRLVIPSGALPVKPGIAHHRVKQGESLAMIARQYGTTHGALAEANHLTDPDKLQPGDVIDVPRGGALADAGSGSDRTSPVAAPRIRKTDEKPVRVASASPNVPLPQAKPDRLRVPEGQVAAAAKETPKKVASIGKLPNPQPMSANKFRWPVRGRVISAYGAKSNGKHNDGINISVPQGTSVKAAENGVVAYAGNELSGYGNLILIRHDDNWVSAYAHNSKLMVKRGDKVRRGQIIAKAGQSGSVSQPQLHFELRKGSRPIDPMRHMAGT